jgi:hypothetical protein
MRIILFTLAIILFMTACNQKGSDSPVSYAATDLSSENLKGNVTQVETDSYTIDSTGKTGPLDEKTIEKFDSSGYTVSFISMNGKDSIKFQTKYQHNANGFLTDMQSTGANDEKKFSMLIDYDSAGKYKLAKSYDSTGKMDVYYTDITSNSLGMVTGAKGYHPDSTLKLTFSNDYDSVFFLGNNSKDSVGKETYSSKVKLNDKKDMAEFDEKTVTTDPKTKKDSTTHKVTTYTYDSWDSNGNWTQQTSLNEKGKPVKIAKRIITYKK